MKNRLNSTSNHVPMIALAGTAGLLGRRVCLDPEGVAAEPPAVVAEPLANLRQEFSRLQTEATGIVDSATAASRDLTAEETTANDTRFARMTTIKNTIDQRERFASMALANPTTTTAVVQRVTEPAGRDVFALTSGASTGGGVEFRTLTTETDQESKFRAKISRDAYANFIRTGEMTHKKFTLTTATGGGVLVPTIVAPPVFSKSLPNPIRAAMAARNLTNLIIRTSGMQQITVPLMDDNANVGIKIAQDATTDNTADPVTTSITLGADLTDSQTVWFSNTLLLSLDYDIVAFVEPRLQTRLDKAQSTAWMTSLAAGTVGVTASSATGVTYSDLVKWYHSVPIAYRGSMVFVVSDGLLMSIENMTDGQNRPLYRQSIADNIPDTLLGVPVIVTADLPAPAANAVTGVAISAEQMLIRDVVPTRVTRYQNVPTRPDQFGLREFANGDFKFPPNGVRTLKQAAA